MASLKEERALFGVLSKDMQVPSEEAMVSQEPTHFGSVNQVVMWVTGVGAVLADTVVVWVNVVAAIVTGGRVVVTVTTPPCGKGDAETERIKDRRAMKTFEIRSVESIILIALVSN